MKQAMPESKFLHVVCKKCKAEQIIFNKASTPVKCVTCGELLAECTGGEVFLKCNLVKTLS